MGVKRALTVGINYPGQAHFLRGCVEDSNTIVKMLKERFGFVDNEIVQLLDDEATTARMKEELHKLVQGSKAGDIIFFHYSGHGTQVIDKKDDPDFEPDGLDEVICPVDFNWRDKVIRDDDLKSVFDCVPAGVNLTVFLDCCNSGGGFDAANEYKAEVDESAENGDDTRDGISGSGRHLIPWHRYLEPSEEYKAEIEASRLQPKTRTLSRKVDATGMLISGAQAHQTAADAKINGIYQGATTYFLQVTLDKLGPTATYQQIANTLNNFMVQYGFSQRPQLDGPVALHNRVFLSEYDFGDPSVVAEHVLADIFTESNGDVQEAVGDIDRPTSNTNIDTSVTVNIGVKEDANVTSDPVKKDDSEDKKKDKTKKMLMIAGGLALIGGLVFALTGA